MCGARCAATGEGLACGRADSQVTSGRPGPRGTSTFRRHWAKRVIIGRGGPSCNLGSARDPSKWIRGLPEPWVRGPASVECLGMDCLFCKIAAGEIPSDRVYEDEHVLVFRDIQPQAPTHLLVVPRAHVASLWELEDEKLAGRLLSVAAQVARDAGLDAGWRLIANTRDDGGQEVPHLHLHVLGGRPMGRMVSPA